jgi:hypothetical protein
MSILAGEPISDSITRVYLDDIGLKNSRKARGFSDSICFSDDDFDFPPTSHPGRELFTFGLVLLAILTFVIWGGWRLIPLMLPSLI